MSVTGRWEGKMLDASGTTSRVVLDLNDSGRKVTGDFSVYIDSGRDGCCGGKTHLAQVAPVSGSFASRGRRLKLKYRLDVGKSPVEVAFDAELVEADPHARRAFLGTYSVGDKEARIGMEGGSCVLWQYAGKRGG